MQLRCWPDRAGMPDSRIACKILVQSMNCGNSERQSVCQDTVCVVFVVKISFLNNFVKKSCARDTLYILYDHELIKDKILDLLEISSYD